MDEEYTPDYPCDSEDSADYSSGEDAEVFLKSCDFDGRDYYDEKVISSALFDGTGHETRVSRAMLVALLHLQNDFDELAHTFRITLDRMGISATLDEIVHKIQSLNENQCGPLPELNRKCPSDLEDPADNTSKENASNGERVSSRVVRRSDNVRGEEWASREMLGRLLYIQNDFNVLVDNFRITLVRRDISAALNEIASHLQALKEEHCGATQPESNRKRKQPAS